MIKSFRRSVAIVHSRRQVLLNKWIKYSPKISKQVVGLLCANTANVLFQKISSGNLFANFLVITTRYLFFQWPKNLHSDCLDLIRTNSSVNLAPIIVWKMFFRFGLVLMVQLLIATKADQTVRYKSVKCTAYSQSFVINECKVKVESRNSSSIIFNATMIKPVPEPIFVSKVQSYGSCLHPNCQTGISGDQLSIWNSFSGSLQVKSCQLVWFHGRNGFKHFVAIYCWCHQKICANTFP